MFGVNMGRGQPRLEAWSTLSAKSGGTLRIYGPLGSIDRNEPSWPTPTASGAPKFDLLPTRIRFGSSTAPGWIYAVNLLGIGFAQAAAGGMLRNEPTCAIADSPGMITATTRSLISASP